MSKNILNISWKKKGNLINYFDKDFLKSKDEALQPITLFFENIDILDIPQDKINNFRIQEKKKEKKSDNSKKSQNFQNSQKSTSNPNKKSEKRKSITDSQIYSSNIVIVQNEENEDLSPTDLIEKEVEKLKRIMSRNREKKKRRANKSYKSNSNNKIMKLNY